MWLPYYIFEDTTGMGMAVTNDRTGAGLPKQSGGNWRLLGEIDIACWDRPRITGASSREIADGVAKDGYVVWHLCEA